MQRRILRPHAVRMKRVAQLHRRFSCLRAIKDHNVRADFLRIDTKPRNFRDSFRQPFGIFVIDVQPRGRLLQRDQARGCDHPRLPHAAAEHFPVDACLLHERLRPRNHRSHRRAQPLRQTKHHRIHFSRHHRYVVPQRGRRVKNPRPIQMHLQPHLMRTIANLFHQRRRINRPASHVVRIFQAHQCRLRIVINLWPYDRLDLLPRQNPILSSRHSRHAPRNR